MLYSFFNLSVVNVIFLKKNISMIFIFLSEEQMPQGASFPVEGRDTNIEIK